MHGFPLPKNVSAVTALALSIFLRDFLGMGVAGQPVILDKHTHTHMF